jgi:CBS domain-containing membrane protein
VPSPVAHALRRLLPPPSTVRPREWLRGAAGAVVGLLVAGLISRSAFGAVAHWPLLIAPMGASAVLLFAVPSSPLAQPWPVVGGNVLAALVGVSCARWIGDPVWAAALAVGGAIAAMHAARCLHPPGGAVALLSVIGAPMIKAQGYAFAWTSVGLNTLLLVLAAALWHRLTGHRYPHPAQQAAPRPAAQGPATPDAPPSGRLGVSEQDVRQALAAQGEVVDIAQDDLQALIRRAELQALARRGDAPRCAQLMSREVVTLGPQATAEQAWQLLMRHRLSTLPVVDGERRVIGVVSQRDLLLRAGWAERAVHGARAGQQPATVAEIMSTPAVTVRADAPLAELVPHLSDAGLHLVPVVDDGLRLQGVVAQPDLIVALAQLLALPPPPGDARG